MLPIRYTSIDSIRQWTVMGGRMPSKSSHAAKFPVQCAGGTSPVAGPARYGPSAPLQLYEDLHDRSSTSNHHFGSRLLWLCNIIPAAIGFCSAMAGPII